MDHPRAEIRLKVSAKEFPVSEGIFGLAESKTLFKWDRNVKPDRYSDQTSCRSKTEGAETTANSKSAAHLGCVQRPENRQGFVKVSITEYRGCFSPCQHDAFLSASWSYCKWRGKALHERPVHYVVFSRNTKANGSNREWWQHRSWSEIIRFEALACHLACQPV